MNIIKGSDFPGRDNPTTGRLKTKNSKEMQLNDLDLYIMIIILIKCQIAM